VPSTIAARRLASIVAICFHLLAIKGERFRFHKGNKEGRLGEMDGAGSRRLDRKHSGY